MPKLSAIIALLCIGASSAGAVDLPVTDVPGTWQGIVGPNPAGTTYTIKAGVSRLQTVVPKSGDKFIGENGAILKGSKILNPASAVAHPTLPSVYYWTGQTQLTTFGTYDTGMQGASAGYERAVHYDNEVFINGKRQRHTNTLNEVDEPGDCYLDADTDRIYVFGSPSGKMVETSLTRHAFELSGTSGVVIENIAVMQYATSVRLGFAIDGSSSNGTIIRKVDGSYNHAGALSVSRNMVIENSRFTFNGQIAFAGGGAKDSAVSIQNVEVAFNNDLHYSNGEEGALKISDTIGGYFRHGWIHDNYQYGLWYDVFNEGNKIYSNLIEGATQSRGIYYEISGRNAGNPAEIYWNQIRNAYDSGIATRASQNVWIYGNAIINQNSIGKGMWIRDEGSPPGMANVKVYNNQISLLGNAKHIKLNYLDLSQITQMSGNKYFGTNKWSVQEVEKNYSQWQTYTYGSLAVGYDSAASGSTFTLSTTALEPSLPAGATAFAYSNYGNKGASRLLQMHLDEYRGTTTKDLSGTGITGTLSNGAVQAPGYLGNAVSFDGTDDYVSVPHSTALNMVDDKITLMGWVNMDSTAGYRTVVSKYAGYELTIREGKVRIQLILTGNVPFSAETTNTPVSGGQWVHVAAVRTGNTISLFVNGVSQPVTYLNPVSTAAILNNTAALNIGRRSNGFLPFDGLIDEVEVYSRALTQQEVQMAMR